MDEPPLQGALRLPRRRDPQHVRVVDGQHLPRGPRPRPRQLRQAPGGPQSPVRPDRALPPPRRQQRLGPLPRPRGPERAGGTDPPAGLPHRRHGAQARGGGPAASGGRAARRPGRRRAGQPGQEHLPGQRQPRDPHAPQRGDRHDGAARRHGPDADAARPPGRRTGIRRGAARHHQRHSRLLEDRGGQADERATPVPSARPAGHAAEVAGAPPPRETRRHDERRRSGRPGRARRRRPPAAAGAGQPAVERDQVHRAGRDRAARARAGADRRHGHAGVRGRRHRHRHPAGQATGDLRGVRPGGRLDDARIRRDGVGAGDRVPAGERTGRQHRPAQRAGTGQHVPLHGPVRSRRGRRGAARARSGRRAPAAPRAAGRGQRRQPAGGRRRAREGAAYRQHRVQRCGGSGGLRRRAVRRRAHGPPDARDGRLRGDPRHPAVRARAGRPRHADRGPYRAGVDGQRGALPVGRLRRLSVQAVPFAGAAGRDRRRRRGNGAGRST